MSVDSRATISRPGAEQRDLACLYLTFSPRPFVYFGVRSTPTTHYYSTHYLKFEFERPTARPHRPDKLDLVLFIPGFIVASFLCRVSSSRSNRFVYCSRFCRLPPLECLMFNGYFVLVLVLFIRLMICCSDIHCIVLILAWFVYF